MLLMLSAVVWNDVDVLEKAGHEIRLEAISDWNVVELIVHEQQVFNCDIRDLDFGERRISYCYGTTSSNLLASDFRI